LKVLLFPNLSATSYSIGDIRNWIQDVSKVCRQSNGAIEPFLALDADVGETIQSFFLLPMSERSDRLRTHFQNSKEGVFWLEKKDGRDQTLSLIDKTDCVLALDNAGALLPLLLDKPVCRDPKTSIELVSRLPKITDWINGRIAEDQKIQKAATGSLHLL
jgi:hypothetical protein